MRTDRAVVAAHHLGADPGPPERRAQALSRHEIVDPPPDVPGPAVAHLAPPGVVAGPLFKLAERVHEAAPEEPPEARPLLVREAGVAAVRPRVGEIDLLMGHVQVPAEDSRLPPGLKPGEVPEERWVPLPDAVVEPGQAPLRVRLVDVHNPVIGKLRRQHPALPVMRCHADPAAHLRGPHTGQHRGPAVALLLGAVPVDLVPAGPFHVLHVARLRLGLLQAHDVGVAPLDVVEQALLQGGPHPVDVPGDDLHWLSGIPGR